jgi:hypothetical protein
VGGSQHPGEFAPGMHLAAPPDSPGRDHRQPTAAPSAALMVAMITPPSVMKMNERRKPVPENVVFAYQAGLVTPRTAGHVPGP